MRLTGATVGTGAQKYTFGYGYDAPPQHDVADRRAGHRARRDSSAPITTAKRGHAPRQLTSITDTTGHVTHTFNYDAAGRQIAEDGRKMTFDAADRVLRVDGVAGGSVAHSYGHDGARVKTVEPNGTVSYFFGDGTAIRNGVREHDVTVGANGVRVPSGSRGRPGSLQGDFCKWERKSANGTARD